MIDAKTFESEREEVLCGWPTGREVNLKEAFAFHERLPVNKLFPVVLKDAKARGELLLQPRAGVALIEDHIRLLAYLEQYADLLPTTIDAYTRQNRYEEAGKGIERSEAAQRSLLNGFPAVNHGVGACREIIEAIGKPVEVRHGTPDARLLAEITLAGGFTSFEGGGISYNIPYAKNVPLERSIRHWQYVDRLVGIYEENGCQINREPFGPLSGTLVPPCICISVAILEGLLALEQGVVSLSLGYGQSGNMFQDIAAIRALETCADREFRNRGYERYDLSTVFHQWMGGFPQQEAKAFSVISFGAMIASLSGADKVIVKTPHEAMGIPTREANRDGLLATAGSVRMVRDLGRLEHQMIGWEQEVIEMEVSQILRAVQELPYEDLAEKVVAAFECGFIDIPFSPSTQNAGRALPVRDDQGAVRFLEFGNIPLDDRIKKIHSERIRQRAVSEKREQSFQMVIDDIYAISKGYLVGRPS